MDKYLLLLALVALSFSAPAQALTLDKVPAPVQATLHTKFPAAKSVAWEKTDQGQYAASFSHRGKPVKALISPAGVLTATKSSLSPGKLPAQVRATLALEYRDYQITGASLLTSPTGVKSYQVEVSMEGTSHPVIFRADGSRVKKPRARKQRLPMPQVLFLPSSLARFCS
ncbi:hypothetical protein [Hymenobacter antarcticus]|uniref:Beta-lactamase-inhibitor-like, PepSY-like n=1 Tax=Hymenobacter antarcticus TaxID=486270 RepID=A0ABP7PZ18_9BACT